MYDPISQSFRFSEFVAYMKQLSFKEMLLEADREANWASNLSHGVRGAPAARANGSTYYAEKIGSFIFFVGQRLRPGGLSQKEFLMLVPIARKLVADGEWNEEALQVFEAPHQKHGL